MKKDKNLINIDLIENGMEKDMIKMEMYYMN